jgi:hypothetical protein
LIVVGRRWHRRRPQGIRDGAEIERTGMEQITLNEGLAWLKTLKKRHEELITLRDGNAHREQVVPRRDKR